MASAGNDHEDDREDTPAPDVDPEPVTSLVEDSGARSGAVVSSDQAADAGAPLEVAAAFVAAIAWGEHLRVWDLLSAEARRVVLRVAVTRGMDERLAARLRDGTAVRTERDTFLADLINGLRADLRGNDLDSLDFQPDPDLDQPDPDRARVMMMAPLISVALGSPLPVASVELVREQGSWRIEHLLPRART